MLITTASSSMRVDEEVGRLRESRSTFSRPIESRSGPCSRRRFRARPQDAEDDEWVVASETDGIRL